VIQERALLGVQGPAITSSERIVGLWQDVP
jgi:hypothetical protein